MDDKHYRARITQRADFAPGLWMIRIDPGAEFSFAPGQYATIGVERDARRLERPYSIVSSPYEKELEFFFELVPGGATTRRFTTYNLATRSWCARLLRDDSLWTPLFLHARTT